LSLGLDFIFIVSYSFFLSLLVYRISRIYSGSGEWLLRLGGMLAMLQFVAAVFDVFENFFLIRLLLGSQAEIFSSLAFGFAAGKFTLIILGIVYVLAGLIVLLIRRGRA